MINNHINYFVQKSGISAPTGTEQIWDANLATYIQDGEIVVTDTFGNVLNTGSTIPSKFVLRYRQGDTVHKTAEIGLEDIVSYKATPYRPYLEQCTILGYNATNNATGHLVIPDASTGAVDDATNYIISLFREDDDSFMGIDRPKSAIYKTGSNPLYRVSGNIATQQEVINGLADIIYKEFIKYPTTGYSQIDLPIKVERICSKSGAGSAKTAVGQTLTVSNESDVVTWSGSLNAAAVKGAMLSLAGKMYVIAEITSVSAGRLRLDVPYQAASGTLASGTGETQAYIYTPTTLYSEYWGIQITGKSLTYYRGLWRWRKTRFQAQTNENITGLANTFGISSVAIDTKGLTTTGTGYVAANTLIPNIAAYDGIGTYQQVEEAEMANLGFYSTEKQLRISVDNEMRRQLTSTTNGTSCVYSLVNINWKKQWNNSTISTVNDSGNIVVAVPITYTDGGAAITLTESVATAATYGFVQVLDTITTQTEATNLITY